MKLKLVVAPYYFYNSFMPPLGVGILSTALQNNHIDYDIDDLHIKLYHAVKNGTIKTDVFMDKNRVRNFVTGFSCDEIKKETNKIMALTKFNAYDCICFSGQHIPLNNIDSQSILICLIKALKNRYRVKIAFNKFLPDYEGMGLVDFHSSDIRLFLDFLKVKKIDTNNNKPWVFLRPNFEGFPRELYKFNRGTVISEFFTGCRRFSDLHQNVSITKSLPLLLPYLFIEGCQNNCLFCEFSEHKGYKVKDYDEVVSDLKFLSRSNKTNNFFFMNSNINPSKHIAIAFTEKILKSGLKIRFTDCATFNNLDEDIIIRLRNAGAVRLVMGLESASIKLQRYVGKVINLDHASRMLKACYKHGIWVELDFLIGLPFESPDDIILTLEFIRDNYKYIRSVNLNRFVLKPSSLLHRFSDKYGITIIKSDPLYAFGYDEKGGHKWWEKKKIMEYCYKRFMECLDRNKVDYCRPAQFVFMVNSQFEDVKSMNKYLDNIFFKDKQWEKRINIFIKELKEESDFIRFIK